MAKSDAIVPTKNDGAAKINKDYNLPDIGKGARGEFVSESATSDK